MSGTRSFLDTNVLLYLMDADLRKAEVADGLVRGGGVVSAQVLNEFIAVGLGKLKLPWPVLRATLDAVCAKSTVVPVAIETHRIALDIAEAHHLHIYDACILAAAQLAGCDTVHTEDMHHGLRLAGVTINNPFASA
jgi:predicted nucleic acid-binding protein